ncbi:hypothetical protein TNCV_194121 [Trichonephila clavipes]|nr:hypothetical protein TNCV_194121 [Trichonephila clavipes]
MPPSVPIKSYIQSVLGLCQEASKRRTGCILTDETDLVSLIRTIVREEVHRLVNQTQESLDSDPQSLEEIVQDEKSFGPVSTKPTETRPRPTLCNQKQAPVLPT